MYILQVSVQNRNEEGGCQPVSSDSSIDTSTPEPQVLTGGDFHSQVSVPGIATLQDKNPSS